VMALPIWGLYMQKVFDDETLPYDTKVKFERPDKVSVETDCDTYNKENKPYNFIEL